VRKALIREQSSPAHRTLPALPPFREPVTDGIPSACSSNRSAALSITTALSKMIGSDTF
jgi:hypothetical protein